MMFKETIGTCRRCGSKRRGKEVWFWLGRIEHTQIDGLEWTMTIHPLDSAQCFICHSCNRRARAKFAISDSDNLIRTSAGGCGCFLIAALIVRAFIIGPSPHLLQGLVLAIGLVLVFAAPLWIKDMWRDRNCSPLSARTQAGFAAMKSELYQLYSPEYWRWHSTDFSERPDNKQFELGTGKLRIMTGGEVPQT